MTQQPMSRNQRQHTPQRQLTPQNQRRVSNVKPRIPGIGFNGFQGSPMRQRQVYTQRDVPISKSVNRTFKYQNKSQDIRKPSKKF